MYIIWTFKNIKEQENSESLCKRKSGNGQRIQTN